MGLNSTLLKSMANIPKIINFNIKLGIINTYHNFVMLVLRENVSTSFGLREEGLKKKKHDSDWFASIYLNYHYSKK